MSVSLGPVDLRFELVVKVPRVEEFRETVGDAQLHVSLFALPEGFFGDFPRRDVFERFHGPEKDPRESLRAAAVNRSHFPPSPRAGKKSVAS